VVVPKIFDVNIEEELMPDGDVVLDDDDDRLRREEQPYPPLPPAAEIAPSEARAKVLAKIQQDVEIEAAKALRGGNLEKAIHVHTEAMQNDGSTAILLAVRAALLLKQKRPCAAIRDCCAAIQLNPDILRAYRLRGIAHRKLGNFHKAYRDLSHAQKTIFDEDTVEVHNFVAEKIGKAPRPVVPVHPLERVAGVEAGRQARAVATPEPVTETKETQEPPKDLEQNQAVTICGLQRAPHLNGKRGIVQRRDPRPGQRGRWEIEVRLGGGQVEVKSIKSQNVAVLNQLDKAAYRTWMKDERQHAEERRMREAAEEQQQYRSAVDAKMLQLPLTPAVREALRALPPQKSFDLLEKVNAGIGVARLNEFLLAGSKANATNVKQSSDSDDDMELDAEEERGGSRRRRTDDQTHAKRRKAEQGEEHAVA